VELYRVGTLFNFIIRDQKWWKSNNYANMTCCDVTCKVQWQTAEYKLAESTSVVYILRRWDLSIVTNTKASLCSDVLSERVLYAIFHRASVKYCVIRASTRVAGRRSYNTKLALFIPSQTVPLPEKPWLQWQLNVWGSLTHCALLPQLSVPSVHSLISELQKYIWLTQRHLVHIILLCRGRWRGINERSNK
jgi:hypothetical protein